MMKRIFLVFFGILAFSWIAFVSYNLLHKENAKDFRSYFNEKDGFIWAIHHPEEVNWTDHSIQTLSLNQSIYSSVEQRMKEPASFIFSSKRMLFLIEKRTSWDKQEIKSLFQDGLFPMELGDLNSFEYGKLHGIYKGNQLLIYDGELDTPLSNCFQLDNKSSLSKITLNKDKAKVRISDMYIKSGRIYSYTKSYISKNHIKSVDDRRIFSPFIPAMIDSYAFYEKAYLSHIDSVFANSPFSKNMIANGIVFITKDSSSAAIFDYEEENSPIENLNELLQKEGNNEENEVYNKLSFSSILGKQTPELFISISNGFAVVSSSKELVDFVISEADLANTLSQDEKRMKLIYGSLPQKVASRQISRKGQLSISIYGNKILETSCRLIDIVEKNDTQKTKDYFVMNPGERVMDFAAFPERGNVIAYTDKNKLVGYINGLKKWEKTCSQEVLSMDLIEVGQSFIAVQFSNEVQLFDKTGRLVFRMTNDAHVRPNAYFSKNKLEFIVANSAHSVQLLNDKGGVVKPFTVQGDIKQLEVTSKTKKPLLGILTNSMYYTIDLEKRKTITKISIDSTYNLVNTGNEILPVSIKNGSLSYLKNGKASQFNVKSNVKLNGSYLINKELVFLLTRGKELYAYQLSGKIRWEKTISAQEISSISIKNSKNGTPIICVLDALENELFIFDQLGRDSDQNERHGETKIQVSPFGTNAYSITTILGSYLIQYTKQ